MNRRRLIPASLASIVALIYLLAVPAALGKDYRYTKWDVDVTVNEDSTLDVVETLTQRFDGDFSGSFRDIDYGDNVLEITDIAVSEAGIAYQPGAVIKGAVNNPGLFSTADYRYAEGYLEILYSFRAQDEEKAFTIQYKVKGGFYYYDETDKFIWPAISEEREKPIDAVSVTVHLPKAITFKGDSIGLDADGRDAVSKQVDGRTVRFTGRNLSPNSHFRVGLEFPKGYVSEDAALLAKQKEVEARRTKEFWGMVVSLGSSVLLVVGVFLGTLLFWWKRGRDADLPPVAEYLTEPPDLTPPAVVSELVFEETDVKDVNATIVDLARRGYLKFWKQPDDTLFQWLGDKGDLRPYELQLVSDLFGGQQTAKLSSFKNKFYSKIPGFKRQVGEESVRLGLYKTAPAATRRRYTVAGVLAVLLGGFLGCCGAGVLSDQFIGSIEGVKNIIIFSPPVAFAIAGILIIFFGYLMPRKTKQGAEAQARWLAFRNYLGNISKYGTGGKAQEIFERYLPYAVAFKMERVFAESFNAREVVPPIWFVPYWHAGYPGEPVSGGAGDTGGGFDLNEMNDGFLSTLNEASSILTSQPSSSGGGSGGFGGGSGGGGDSGSW